MEGKNNNFLRSFYQNLSDKLTKKDSQLPSLEEVLMITKAKSRTYLGVLEIEVDKIIGSEGRWIDFERGFVPVNLNLKKHLLDIERLYAEGYHFPPISVYKIDEYYFVRDGNHRVAAAKTRGQIFIDAEVTEIYSSVPITKELTTADKEVIAAHAEFLHTTGLEMFGRDANINLTKARSYGRLVEIIEAYGKNLKPEGSGPLVFSDVSKQWYTQVFLPFAEDAYRFDLLARFPKKTTGDLYVWVQTNWAKLKRGGPSNDLHYLPSDLEGKLPVEDPATNREIKLFHQVIANSLKLEDNFLLTHHIGVTVANMVVILQDKTEPKVVLARRRYHPSERRWSLPIAMLRPEEEFRDAALRAIKMVLGYDKAIPMVHFCTHDRLDRYPFGRCLGVGMIGFVLMDKNTSRFLPGHMTDAVEVRGLSNLPELVFDHADIINEGLQFLLDKSSDLNFISQYFPNHTSLQLLNQNLETIKYFLATHKIRPIG